MNRTSFCPFVKIAAAMLIAASLTCPSVLADDSVDAVKQANALSNAFRQASEKATPSVVVVRSETKPKPQNRSRNPQRGGENPFRGTPFEEFFPDGFDMQPGPRSGPRSGVGSGVIVDQSGIVLTNNHVVEGADVVTVELSDGREFKAREIKTDPDSDLAVIRLEGAKNLPTAQLGNSDELQTGDWVIAIGNPFELETTVSAGIISGKGRELGGNRAKFLQTDAAINPGNSGGPLVNLRGEVIGINTAIASNSGGYQGIGFAIPINLAKWVSEQLIAKGAVERGYMGVSIGPLSREMAAKLGVNDRKGVLVTEVMPDTPAAKAGVQELDVIKSFDGQEVDGPRTLQGVVERAPIGKKYPLKVIRDGQFLTLSISVKSLPNQLSQRGSGMGQPKNPPSNENYYSRDFGLAVRDKGSVNEDAYADFDGVLVDRVDPDGIASEAGLGPGVLIRKVGRTEVTTIAEFAAALEKESPDEGVILQVRTPRGNNFVLLKKDA